MVHSSDRKLALSGWLKKYHKTAYDRSLKLQKFLFLYESFSKAANDAYEFDSLKGYKNGPVFSNVWGDYTKEGIIFSSRAEKQLEKFPNQINEERARKVAFIVNTLSETELSQLTHEFNIWGAKRERIQSGEYQVELEDRDFNKDDIQIVRQLDLMFPNNMVDRSTIIEIENHYFVISSDDMGLLTEQHMDVLSELSMKASELHNPIFVDIDEEGRLNID